MNKQFLITLTLLSGFFISCEKDDDHSSHSDECHPCHIAIEECCGTEGDHAPGEHPWDIPGEFCGDDLVDIEANGWVATQDVIHEDVVIYAEGTLVPASVIHCEEHAGHNHD